VLEQRWNWIAQRWPDWAWPTIVAVVAWGFIVTHLDPSGSYPQSGEGPGLTVDESFNVQQGVLLVEVIRQYGLVVLDPVIWREEFGSRLHLVDHPPLGRLWLGIHHHLTWWWHPPNQPDGPIVTACARTGSATAFALTILLVGWTVSGWYGQLGGLLSAVGLALLPRVYGHAHSASLESITNLVLTAAVLAVANSWPGVQRPHDRTAAWTGVLLGLAFLTKMQAIFIPPAVVLWACWQWRWRALRPLAIWGLVGLAVMVIGWPWLWFDTLDHLWGYFRRSGQRAELNVWLFGHGYTDRSRPWTYALWALYAVTPVKIFVGFSLGCSRRLGVPESKETATAPPPRGPRELLLLTAIAVPLLAFSMPYVPVYDMERLFLPVFPLILVVVGRGCQLLYWRFQTIWPSSQSWKQLLMLAVGLLQIISIYRIAPYHLSYYSGTFLGLPHAHELGMELDYWGQSQSRSLWQGVVQTVPRGSRVALAPVLHQFWVDEVARQSPIIRGHALQLVPFDPQQSHVDAADYVVLFRRQADLSPELKQLVLQAEPLVAVREQGVLLAGLYAWPAESPSPASASPASP
jgi:4-amino-4-deoxy-L-arabinose transferase-like glycosyltransferase